LRRIFILLISALLGFGQLSPAQAEEAPNPLIANINSQPGLLLNPVPTEASVGAKFSLNGSLDPVAEGVSILRQTKKGEKWSTVGSTKSKADKFDCAKCCSKSS